METATTPGWSAAYAAAAFRLVVRVGRRIDEQDVGPGSQGGSKRPLDVDGDLVAPTGVAHRQAAAAGLVHLGEHRRIGDAELEVELVQVAGDVGVIEGVDDRNGRSRAVAGHRSTAEADLVEPVVYARI